MAETPAAPPSGCNGEPQHAFTTERGANCPIWVRRCMLCGEIDWQDLINEAATLTVASGVDEVVIRSQERAACEGELQAWRERAETAEAVLARVSAVHCVHNCVEDGHVLDRTPNPCANNGVCSCGQPGDRCPTRIALGESLEADRG